MTYKEMSILDELRHYFYNGSMVVRLILFNVATFCLLKLFLLLCFLLQTKDIHEWLMNHLMLPASINGFIWQPWSILTYMFLHENFFHILLNMLMLNLFGNILGDLLGNRRILPIYLLGGIAGGGLYMLLFQLLPVFQNDNDTLMLGASASVMAIMGAATALQPNYSINLLLIGNIRIKWITLFLVLIDLFAIPQSNSGGHIAHLGGVLIGFLYIKQLQNGTDWTTFINNGLDKIVSLWNRTYKTKRQQPQVVYRSEKVTQNSNTSQEQNSLNSPKPRAARSKSHQEKIDSILDKISQKGYDSLTTEEKTFLFQLGDNENDE